MDLTLTIIESPNNVNMLNHTKAFHTEGGTFGRSDNNNWVLPDNDRVISSVHAEIFYRDGAYYLSDTSTNGTFHNSESDPIGTDVPREISNGDTLSAGGYKFKVCVAANEKNSPKGLQAADFLDSADKTTFTLARQGENESLSHAKQLDDWLTPDKQKAAEKTSSWGSVESPSVGSRHSFPATSSVNTNSVNTISALHSESCDPLASFGASDNPISAECIDPLLALDRAGNMNSPIPSIWESEGDDWWKEGSVSDNAPANTHTMNLSITSEVNNQAPQSSQDKSFQPSMPDVHNQFVESTASPSYRDSAWDNQPHLKENFSGNINEAVGLLPQVNGLNRTQIPVNHAQTHTDLSAYVSHENSTPSEPRINNAPQPIQKNAAPPSNNGHAGSASPTSTLHTSTLHTDASSENGHPTAIGIAEALGISNLPAQHLRQLIPEATAIIQETVDRLIDLLRARSSIKNELRVQRTMIQATDNNPLKFSATSSDAIKTMFSLESLAFMRPQDAIKDSFDDLSDHQVAVLSGMRAAYGAMLKHFNPELLSKRFNNQGHLLSNKKAKDWDSFGAHYTQLLRDKEATYDILFGDEFADAYEKQLSQLKTARSLTSSRR